MCYDHFPLVFLVFILLTPLPGPSEDGLTYDSIIISSDSLDSTVACEFDDSSMILV